MTNYCGTCAFYDPTASFCRWEPPTGFQGGAQGSAFAPGTIPPPYVTSITAYWPWVSATNDWCGMWAAIGAPPPAPYYLYCWAGTGGTTTVPSVMEYPSQAAAQAAQAQLLAAAPALKFAIVPVGT